MNAKLSQRSVRVEDVSTVLGATAVNVPRAENLTQTLRNASVGIVYLHKLIEILTIEFKPIFLQHFSLTY